MEAFIIIGVVGILTYDHYHRTPQQKRNMVTNTKALALFVGVIALAIVVVAVYLIVLSLILGSNH